MFSCKSRGTCKAAFVYGGNRGCPWDRKGHRGVILQFWRFDRDELGKHACRGCLEEGFTGFKVCQTLGVLVLLEIPMMKMALFGCIINGGGLWRALLESSRQMHEIAPFSEP